MNTICPKCQAAIPEANVNAQTGIAMCGGCGEVFSITVVNPLPEAAMPHSAGRFCGNCGAQLPNDVLFCGNCGTKQEELPPATQLVQYEQTPYEPPSSSPSPVSVYNQIFIAPAPAQNASVPPSTGAERKLRHGFTSFWLWLHYIWNIVGFLFLIILFLLYNEYEEVIEGVIEELSEIILYFFPALLSLKTLLYWSIAVMAATIFGLWKIIKKWQRSGFYWLVAANSVTIVITLIYLPSNVISTIWNSAIYIGLTYLILRLRNGYNAKSTWEQLD